MFEGLKLQDRDLRFAYLSAVIKRVTVVCINSY